jgi:aspartate/methionine/tyrosine aminotransferase
LIELIDEDERQALFDTKLVYVDGCGTHNLREAIAEMQGVDTEEVVITTGAAEALLILFFLAADPGANVILPAPCFPPTAELPRSLGLETRFYHLRRDSDFKVDLDEIKRLADDRTKLLLVNTPHNPTGATLSDDELRLLHGFALERGIQFVVDEVYHPIYHGRETASAAALEKATVLGDFSKALCLSGLRVGWIVERDRKRIQEYVDARSYFTISSTPIGEALATVAVRSREKIFDRVRKVAGANLLLLERFFSEQSDVLGWVRPRGGMTVFPWLKSGADARAFSQALAERGVLVAPGDCFNAPEHFRLGFGARDVGFANALEIFSDFIHQYRGRAAEV